MRLIVLLALVLFLPCAVAAQSDDGVSIVESEDRPDLVETLRRYQSHCQGLLSEDALWLKLLTNHFEPFTTGELSILSRLCEGSTFINLRSAYGYDELECNPAHIEGSVPEHRTVRAGFLEWLLVQPELRAIFFRPEFILECARIEGRLDLNYAHIPMRVSILNSQFMGKVELIDAHFERLLSFDGSTFERPLEADRLQVRSSLHLRDSTHFKSWVDLSGAQIKGVLSAIDSVFESAADAKEDKSSINMNDIRVGRDLLLHRARIERQLDLEYADIGNSLFFTDARVERKVFLVGTRIGAHLFAPGANFRGSLSASQISVGKAIFLRNGAHFFNEIDIRHASIGSNLETTGSRFEGPFEADKVTVENDVLLTDGSYFATRVDFVGARVGGSVWASNSEFDGRIVFRDFHVDGNLVLEDSQEAEGEPQLPTVFSGDVDLRRARIDKALSVQGSLFEAVFDAEAISVGTLLLRGGATFNGKIKLTAAEIRDHLQFGSSTFNSLIEITGAQIGAELLISSPGPEHGEPVWGSDAELSLRNVRVPTLQAEIGAWQRDDGSWVKTDLTGFRYDRLGGLNAEKDSSSPNMADVSAGDLTKWIIESQGLKQGGQYDPQPFEQLASALDASGSESLASQIRYEKLEHRRRSVDIGWDEWLGLVASKWFIGHGEGARPVLFPLAWMGVLMLAGIALGFFSKAPQLAPFWSKFWFSIGNTLPLVELHIERDPLEHDGIGEGILWISNLFYAQKVFGFILATVFIGALTLL